MRAKEMSGKLEAKEGRMCVGKTVVQWKTLGGANFKANAKRTKNGIVSLAPLLMVSAGAHGVESLLNRDRRERFREFGTELPKIWGMMCGFLSRGCPRCRPHRRRRRGRR